MAIALVKNADAIFAKEIKQQEHYDHYRYAKQCYYDYKYRRWQVPKSKRSDVIPTPVFATNMQNWLTHLGMVISDVTVSVKLKNTDKDSTNPSYAIEYLCKTILHKDDLYNLLIDEINHIANISKHKKVKVRFAADECVSGYNRLIGLLCNELNLPSLSNYKIKIPTNPKKAADAAAKAQTNAPAKTVPQNTETVTKPSTEITNTESALSKTEAAPVPSTEYIYTPQPIENKPIKWAAVGAATTVVIIGAILLATFSKQITWYQWQWIIGSLSGAVISAACVVAIWLINHVTEWRVYIMGLVLLWIFIIANTVLFGLFRERYVIIAAWIYGYATVLGVISCILAYCNYDNKCGVLQFGNITCTISAFIVSIILAVHVNNITWFHLQIIVGFLICLFVLVVSTAVYWMIDEEGGDTELFEIILLYVLVIINSTLLAVLRERYKLISMCAYFIEIFIGSLLCPHAFNEHKVLGFMQIGAIASNLVAAIIVGILMGTHIL